MTCGFILTFHSQNISGNTCETNDHVALNECVEFLQRERIPVLRLLDVVRRLRRGTFSSLPARFACITFDDGTNFDWQDIPYPNHGPQISMGSILRARSFHLMGSWWLRRICATSFVIASPDARTEISMSWVGRPDMISDDWWRDAQKSGLMDIGSHGWDHVHPSVSWVRERPDLLEAFGNVLTPADANLQIAESFRYIQAKAGGDSGRLFAYPYGQVSEFVAKEYLPRQHDTLAAFTTEPRPLQAACDVWRLPRYVYGWHWKSDDDLRRIILGR